MSGEDDRNYVSVWSWMLLMLVVAIPCVGWIAIIVLAFVGDNETRKNYFRAILAWIGLGFIVVLCLMLAGGLAGNWDALQKHIQQWIHRPS